MLPFISSSLPFLQPEIGQRLNAASLLLQRSGRASPAMMVQTDRPKECWQAASRPARSSSLIFLEIKSIFRFLLRSSTKALDRLQTRSFQSSSFIISSPSRFTMKLFLFSLLASFGALSQGWVLRNELRKAAAAATIGAAGFAAPFIANAVDFTGSYSDPNHPNCQRIIEVTKGSKTASLKGTDGNPGCPADGSGKEWKLTGQIKGDSILIDFSPKGGPADLEGKWDGTGIKFPDGNKWTLKTKVTQ
jgi:hypothetical protein